MTRLDEPQLKPFAARLPLRTATRERLDRELLRRRQVERRRDRLRRLRRMAIVSLVLHAAGLAIALLVLHATPPDDNPVPPSPVAMVFDAGKKAGPSQPEPEARQRAPTPPSPQPPPIPQPAPTPPTPAPPVVAPPEAEPAPPQPPAPAPPVPQPPSPPVQAPPAPEVPPPPPPMEHPSEAAPPAVRLPPTPSAPPAVEPEPLPTPPIPPPPTPRPRLAARPPRPVAPSPPSRAPGDFPMPTMRNWSLGSPKQGPASLSPTARVDSAALGADWMNALSAWIEQHKYYPEQAVRDREDGDVTVTVVVRADGHVQTVQLERRSGSMWLDLAWQAMFRDAQLPPFPPGTADRQATLHLTMRYLLLH